MTDGLLRACVPGADGNEWLVLTCAQGEACIDGASSDAGAGAVAACVGTCDVGQAECVSDALARVCTAGGIWSLDTCEFGEQCLGGVCQPSDAGVQRCVVGATQCASETVLKICDEDGTAWVQQNCPAGQACEAGACVADPGSSCDARGNICLDNKTALRCLGEDDGYEVIDCPGDTYCENGRCRGSNCQLGTTCINNDPLSGNPQVRDCVDGETFRDSECKTGELCRQVKDNAFCEPIECNVGTTVCGDPDDPNVDPDKFYRTCVNGAFSNVPEWVNGECLGTTICQPGVWIGNNPCRTECTDGAQRCATDNGVAQGISTCVDGIWGPVESCNPGLEVLKVCMAVPTDDPAALPQRVCGEPICANNTPSTCDGDQIRLCNDNGVLGAPQDCEDGAICRATGGAGLDGIQPGDCDAGPECVEGESRCEPNDIYGTRFSTCVNGQWSQDLKRCPDNDTCANYTDYEGLRHHLCSSECIEGSRRCDLDRLQTCTGGAWNTGSTCDVGACINLGNRDAACAVQCIPGEVRCVGFSKQASDYWHNGTDSQQTCGADGLWGSDTSCPGSETCRVSGNGEHLGCIQCIGPDIAGGNSEGLADSYCPGNTTITSCAPTNTWPRGGEACTAGTECYGGKPQICGECTTNNGVVEPICTLTNVQANQVCGPCGAAGGAQCTYANIQNYQMLTCTAANPNNPALGSAWGGALGCCASAQLNDTAVACNTWQSWGGYADCCVLEGGGGGQAVAECR